MLTFTIVIQEQRDFIENLSQRYHTFSTDVNAFMVGTSRTILVVEESCKDTLFQLKELKDYVDHFADNLVLSSGQITVDVDAGFSIKPVSLTETLQICRGTITDIEKTATGVGTRIDQITAELETKAPDSVLFNINTIERKIATIEVHLRKEEEQGVGVSNDNDDLINHSQSVDF